MAPNTMAGYGYARLNTVTRKFKTSVVRLAN